MLEFITDTVPENLKDFYEPGEGGKFVLKVNGVVAKSKLDEFRAENVILKQKLEELDGIGLIADAKTGEKVRETIESLVKQRSAAAIQAAENAKKELEAKVTTTSSRLNDLLINNEVSKASMTHGVEESALEDVNARVRRAFKVEEDKIVPVDGQGDSSGSLLTIDTFLADLKTKAPHLFKKSQGTGAFSRTRGMSPSTPTRSTSERLAGFAALKTQKR
jgi:hypothetical protein